MKSANAAPFPSRVTCNFAFTILNLGITRGMWNGLAKREIFIPRAMCIPCLEDFWRDSLRRCGAFLARQSTLHWLNWGRDADYLRKMCWAGVKRSFQISFTR